MRNSTITASFLLHNKVILTIMRTINVINSRNATGLWIPSTRVVWKEKVEEIIKINESDIANEVQKPVKQVDMNMIKKIR